MLIKIHNQNNGQCFFLVILVGLFLPFSRYNKYIMSSAVRISSNKDVFISEIVLCAYPYFLNFNWEGSVRNLILPFFNPCIWADVMEHLLEIVARFIVLATQLLASVEVDEWLSTVARLVGVWEPWIEWSAKWQLLLQFCFGWFRHLVLVWLKSEINQM